MVLVEALRVGVRSSYLDQSNFYDITLLKFNRFKKYFLDAHPGETLKNSIDRPGRRISEVVA